MGSHETPEQIEARKAVFTRFNRLRMIQEEKNRAKVTADRLVTSADLHKDPWGIDMLTDAWRKQQLEYVKPYLGEYEQGTATLESQKSRDSLEQSESIKEDEDTISTTSSRPSALISRLTSLRGRGRNIKNRTIITNSNHDDARLETSSSVPTCFTRDFDLTSTIVPPTELQPEAEGVSTARAEELKSYFSNNYKPNTSLPIYLHRKHIINSINSYSVVIIEGSTGCGKTTQVPMYILEDAVIEKQSKQAPMIYVTQPRRIAARSIAERVCAEHQWTLGTIVGYQVGLEKKASPQTALVFCTAGVLLQKIIQEKSLKNYTHIIIDEAHERDADTDLLLMMIRKLMLTETLVFRLTIMSATMEIEKLRKYFTFRTTYGHQAVITPSFVKLGDNKSPNDVQIVYQDKFNHLFNLNEPVLDIDMDNPELLEGSLKTAVKIIVDVIPHLDNYTEISKSTLVFLPGLAEISKLDRMIRACPGATEHLDIIPLHSCLTAEDQYKVFTPSKPGFRKVILATNIAESSITVSDIGFIVDFCLTKVLMKDPLTRFPTLKLIWSTQDKCTQRAGRTGRCCPGKVFRMLPFNVYRNLREYAEPELLVAPLELSVLRVKNFNMGEIQGLLAVVLDPPPFDEIRTAVLELKQIGALSSTYKGKLSDIDGDLTSLGKIISSLPIDVHLSKLIVIAHVFDILEPAITVAACLSTNRTIVKHMYGNQLESYDRKLDWSNDSFSDLFVCLDVFDEYEAQKRCGRQGNWLKTWCHKKALDERKLMDVSALSEEIKIRLSSLNISTVEQPNRERNIQEDRLMLKVAFCASFYPNFFLTDKLDKEKIDKELKGLNPARTVIMHNIPTNQVPLFKTRIEAPIKAYINSEFEFIADNSRAMLVFQDEAGRRRDEQDASAIGIDGLIEPSRGVSRNIYRAIKLGENLDLVIRQYTDSAASERMRYYYNARLNLQRELGTRLAPSLMKIVDRSPDNQHLLLASDSEFNQLMNSSRYSVEIQSDTTQDLQDQRSLRELEQREQNLSDGFESEHPVFRSSFHRIRGPESPIRMIFRSVLVKSRGFSVDIDPNSINSILLDADYEKDRRQMLVAASVSQNKRNRVLARDTTMMPNIRGLPTLMALLFAQYYRLVFNVKLNCISGAIFGLGWNDMDLPLDRAYEVDLGFDVHITSDDIELINAARHRMSELLRNEVLNAGLPRANMQEQLRDIILRLVRKRRYPLQELDISTVDYPADDGSDIFIKDKHNLPDCYAKEIDESREETRPFLPLMEATRQFTEMDLYHAIRHNLNQLECIAKRDEKIPPEGIRCLLCGNGMRCFFAIFHSLLEHIQSERHNDLLKEFEVFEHRAKSAAVLDRSDR